MKSYRFRSVDEWKSAIMNLPLFFDLMRSIFGNIKTPYNKQRLLDDLFVLLSRDDIRRTISSYIDEEDHRVIAAAALLHDPPLEELETFFQGEKNSVSLRGLLLNLEERLILFRFFDETHGVRRLALNPVLEPVLAPIAAQTGILFPALDFEQEQDPNKTADTGFPVSDDRTLGAFFAFISAEEDFFKAEGIRKKVHDQGEKLFPGLDLDAAAEALKFLGLYYSEGGKFLPVNRKIRGFGELSPAERREYWAAGLYFYLYQDFKKNMNPRNGDYRNTSLFNPGFGSFGLSRNQINNLADLIHQFCRCLDPKKQYPKITLQKILLVSEQEYSGNPWDFPERIKADLFIDALTSAGILRKSGWTSCQNSGRNSNQNSGGVDCLHYVPVKVTENSGPVIAMDSPFSFILYPGISFRDTLKLSAFSDVKEDTPFSFELTRTSVVRGFDAGINSDSMIKTLKEFTGNRMDEGLEWTLKDWESRYDSVLLHEGLVLYLSEDKRYLAETEPVAPLIKKKIAPGLYLLGADSAEATAALQKAGVDIIARPQTARSELNGFGGSFPSLGKQSGSIPVFQNVNPEHAGVTAGGRNNETMDHFLKHLEKLKMTKPEKNELTARIERRVILTEAQLDGAAVKFQKLEARGLDYTGKISIVKQAMAEGSALEVTRTDPVTGDSITTGVPSALEKNEGGNVLVLKPFSGEENGTKETEIIRVPLGKISLLRLIKRSIFSY
ncbi:MAG: helicase-associated domain-containing protein [Treponema sp.]|nr:helicase-associated domain-containing protein [Treponema sp.]